MSRTYGINSAMAPRQETPMDLFGHHAPVFEESEEEFQERKAAELTPEETFNIWKELPGAKHVIAACYRWAAFYVKDWQKTGIPVAIALIREQVRRDIKIRKFHAKAKGVKVQKWKGYTLPNNHSPYIARHIESHRPEWAGMFEKHDTL